MHSYHYDDDHYSNRDITTTAADKHEARREDGWFECRWDDLLSREGKLVAASLCVKLGNVKQEYQSWKDYKEEAQQIPFLWRFINSLLWFTQWTHLFWFVPA